MLSPTSKTRLKTYLISKQSPVHGDLFLLNEIQKALSIVEDVKKELVEKMDALILQKGDKGDKGDSIVGAKGDKGDRGKDGKNGNDGHTPVAGIDFPLPKDGEDGQSIVGPAGKDADIKELEKNLPQFGIAFRDGLELLPNGEKMKIDAIEDLREELEKIRQIKGTLGRAMGPSVITPRPLWGITASSNPSFSGSINGTNKDFTLPEAPTKNGLALFLNGVRMREGSSNDFTLSGKTVSFLNAPLTGDIIICDFDF